MNVFLSFYGINDDDEWNKKEKKRRKYYVCTTIQNQCGFFLNVMHANDILMII